MEYIMHTKTHKLQFKKISEDGYFEGYASVFNVLDHQGDIILPGAFRKTLKKGNLDKNLKMLWQHDMEKPIGIWEHIIEDGYGLYVKGRLLMDISLAKEAYTLLKAGVVDGLSIGYTPVHSHFDASQKAKCLTDVDLLEISLVTFAANPKAKVTSVKNNCFIADRLRGIKNNLRHLKDCFEAPTLIENFF
jgi:HK97 family phage prohead protease